ncbi:hypothetical protein [Dyadobacter sp.]|uniref:hypothetical protein n=1 Tax=Dyadobacter sp. TaxID=1914288 RepID=UPI003F728FAC
MSKFTGTTRISNSNFHGFFEIYGSTIDKKISIIDSKFGNIFELDNLNIIEPPLFYNSELPDTLNLFSLKLDSLKRELDFSDCVLGKRAIENGRKCLVQIYDTDISKLILPSHLFTIDSRNDERLTSSAKLDRLSQTYERLIRKSKDLGMMNSAEGWDIEYQRRLND